MGPLEMALEMNGFLCGYHKPYLYLEDPPGDRKYYRIGSPYLQTMTFRPFGKATSHNPNFLKGLGNHHGPSTHVSKVPDPPRSQKSPFERSPVPPGASRVNVDLTTW